MAPPNNFNLLFFFLLFLSFHCSLSLVPPLIDQVCSRTQNHDSCVQTLTSVRGAYNSDLKGLNQVSLDLAEATATENKGFIRWSLEKVTDSGVKQVLEHCDINYGGSVSALGLAVGNLDKDDYEAVNLNTHIAKANANDCDRVIKQGPPPPGLQDRNAKMWGLTDICVAASDLLVKVTKTSNATPLINQICSKAKNQDFCFLTLTAFPAGADLKTLGDLSLKSSYIQATQNQAYISALLQAGTDPGVKRVLDHCKINYDGSVGPLKAAMGALEGGELVAANDHTGLAVENLIDCDRVIKTGPAPPTFPDKNNRALQLVEISKIICNMLINK